MGDQETPGRYAYKARAGSDGTSRGGSGSSSKLKSVAGVAELLAKSRIEQSRHERNLRRAPHPDFAATPISSMTTSTSYPLPPTPFPLAEDHQSATLASLLPRARPRIRRPPGPSAPASWSAVVPDTPRGATTLSGQKWVRDPARELERRLNEYELWFQYAYAGRTTWKGKEKALVGSEMVPGFALSWSDEDGRTATRAGQDRLKLGPASLQASAIVCLTRYALTISSIPLDRTTRPSGIPDPLDTPDDPLTYFRVISPLLTEQHRMGMMLARAGMAMRSDGQSARTHRQGMTLEGVLGIWNGWKEGRETPVVNGGGRTGFVVGRSDRAGVETALAGSVGEVSIDEESDVGERSQGCPSDDDWDVSPELSPDQHPNLHSTHSSPSPRHVSPLPILDLSYLPALSLAETKLLRSMLHSLEAYRHLTRLSFAGSGLFLGDVMGLLPVSGGGPRGQGAGTGSGGGVRTGRTLRLTHLSLAGLKSRDGKELERSVGKLVRLFAPGHGHNASGSRVGDGHAISGGSKSGSELEVLDLSGLQLFQEFGLWALLGKLFDPEAGEAISQGTDTYGSDEGTKLESGIGTEKGTSKFPALRVLGLKNLLPFPAHVDGDRVMGKEEMEEKATRVYGEYVQKRRARGGWVDLVFA